MIKKDQPRIFGPRVHVVLSSLEDGSMRHPLADPTAKEVMAGWLPKHGFDPRKTVGLKVTYGDDQTYDTIVEVNSATADRGVLDSEAWVEADVLVTATANLALLLPVADCNAVLVHDPKKQVLALAHLGRHASVVDTADKVVDYLKHEHGTDPKHLKIFFSPSIRKNSYVFTHLSYDHGKNDWHQPPYATPREDGKYEIDLVAYNQDKFIGAGVLEQNIEVSPVDTATDENYYSHYAKHNLNDSRQVGRFVLVAELKPSA